MDEIHDLIMTQCLPYEIHPEIAEVMNKMLSIMDKMNEKILFLEADVKNLKRKDIKLG